MKLKLMMVAAGLLACAVLAQTLHYKPTASAGKGVHLHQLLPENLPGWSSRSMPLGATEAVEKDVIKILNFDDVYYREFSSPRGTISLYAAYWNPGKMPTQLIAIHTPDRCWTSAGWHCEAIRHQVRISGLLPGEWRNFSAPGGEDLNVIYWQLEGGKLYDFGDRFNRVPSPWRWWRDAVVQMFRAPPEQYFIRLSSNRPFTEWESDPGFRELIAAMGRLGLAEGGLLDYRPRERRGTGRW